MIAVALLPLAVVAGAGNYASVGGLKMYYEVHGSGPPLVMLHGGSTTIDYSFGKILPVLAKTHKVIAIEQQGHGHTRDIERPLSYSQMAEDTVTLLKQLKVESADFLGWSDGGKIAIQIAVQHPKLVHKIIATGSNYSVDGIDPDFVKWLQGVTADAWPKGIRDAYEKVAPDPKQWPRLIAKVKKLWLDFKGWPAMDLQAIRAPVLVMVGDGDWVRPEHALQMFRMFPNGQFAVLPGTSHATVVERPEWFLAMAEAFLSAPMPDGK